MATLDLGRVTGKGAYEYAVDGGYTGTEEEFKALMADAASKEYVNGLFNQVAPVIVKVQLVDSSGSAFKSYNVKCYPAATGILSYSINFSLNNDRDTFTGQVNIIPPDQYAFTGLYGSSGIVLEFGDDVGTVSNPGVVQGDGTVSITSFPSNATNKNWTITGSFTLEVA